MFVEGWLPSIYIVWLESVKEMGLSTWAWCVSLVACCGQAAGYRAQVPQHPIKHDITKFDRKYHTTRINLSHKWADIHSSK